MRSIIDLSSVDKTEENIAPIAHLDGQELDGLMTESEFLKWAGENEDLLILVSSVDWDTYSYVLPIGDKENCSDYYSFKSEWVKFTTEKYQVGVNIEIGGYITVDANSEEEAKLIVENMLNKQGVEAIQNVTTNDMLIVDCIKDSF